MSNQGEQKCNSGNKGIEDEPVKLSPGMVPDTLTFKCAAKESTPQDNQQQPESVKTDQSKYPPKYQPQQKPAQQECSSAPPPIKQQCAVPETKSSGPETKCSVPETLNFQCKIPEPEKVEPQKQCCKEQKKEECPDNNANAPCGIPLRPSPLPTNCSSCNCNTAVAPRPTVAKPCGKQSANCGPNTSCAVIPLTMAKKTN